MTSRSSQIWMILASLLLGGMFVFPLWFIGLIAPQYPEGLGMVIGINTITGMKAHDLNNINELNHYIGMKVIDPSLVPELRILPWVVGALVVLGLVAALWKRRSLIIAWLASMIVFAIASGIDFWRWTYDYGHNLDIENAILKIPGTVYQPPLLGSKQILNFTATSWPGLGVWCAVAAFIAGIIALLIARRASAKATLATVAITLSACTSHPTPIAYNQMNCESCGMTISDNRFGAELVTTRGKVYMFDSVECLVDYYLTQDTTKDIKPTVWVTDFQQPGTLIPATTARYVYGATRVHSPMGRGLLALAPTADADAIAHELEGIALSWSQLIDTLSREEEKTVLISGLHLEHDHGIP